MLTVNIMTVDILTVDILMASRLNITFRHIYKYIPLRSQA